MKANVLIDKMAGFIKPQVLKTKVKEMIKDVEGGGGR